MAAFEPLFSVNGSLGASVSAADRGLAYGDGLFETIRLHAGQLPFLSCHLDRLLDGADRLSLPITRGHIEDQLAAFCADLRRRNIDDGVVKVIVTRGANGRGYNAPPTVSPTVILGAFPLPEIPADCYDGVDVCVCAYRLPDNAFLAGCKHLNKLDYVIAAGQVDDSRYREGLLLDNRNQVVEGTRTNLFVLHEGELQTPVLARAGVKGVLRRLIIEQYANAVGVRVAERDFDISTICKADEVFLCNSIVGIWPVKSVAGQRITRGDVTRRLQSQWRADLQRRTEHAA